MVSRRRSQDETRAVAHAIAVVHETPRYVQQQAMSVERPGLPTVRCDGITELWFDGVDAIARCFGAADDMAKIRPDEGNFLDLHACDFIVSAETVIGE